MSKKDFIALADEIRATFGTPGQFNDMQILVLAKFCKRQNYNFKELRWLGYIKGENGPSGGAR